MIRTLFIAGLFFLSTHIYAEEIVGGMSLERLQRFEDVIQSDIESGKISGSVSLVSRGGETVYFEALGVSDVADGSPMTTDQIFFIQSMTKPIISVAFMMLFEEGHFDLDEPVAKYLPEFADWEVLKDPEAGADGETVPQNKPITIRHILTHTSGMTHALGPSKLDQDIRERAASMTFSTVQERLAALMEFPLYGQPGEQWHYSFSPDVLSVLIEQVSGMSTNEFLETRIFQPLGMADTGYNLSDEQLERVAPLHVVDKEGQLMVSPKQDPRQGNTLWSGVNGLWSTAEDYLTFSRMMMNGGELNGTRILSRKTVELMISNHVGDLYRGNGGGWGFGLGYGVVTDSAEAGALLSEGTFTWGGAYNTAFFIDPQEELVAIFMTQLFPHGPGYSRTLGRLVPQAIAD